MITSTNGNLYNPEILPLITSGQTPAYNAFPYASINRDLESLLSNPATDFANNVQSAASGALVGIVYNGDVETLVYDLLSSGRQLEATQQWKCEQAKSRTKAEQADLSEQNAKSPDEDIKAAGDEKKAANDNNEEKSRGSKLCLSADHADSVTAIGKLLAHIVESEFTVSVPLAKMHTITPAALPPSLGLASKVSTPAFNLHC